MNDEFYKNVISKLPVGYVCHKIICDDLDNPYDYEFIDANQVGKELISAWNPDIIGKRFREIYTPTNSEMTDWIETCGNIALNGGEVYLDKYVFNTSKMLKVKIWSPEKYYFIVYFMDITQETRQIMEAEGLLHNLFDIIFELDRSYVFKYVVAKDEKMLFLPKDQIIGRSINEIFDDTMTEMVVSAIIRGFQSGMDETITYSSDIESNQRWFQALIKCVDEGVDSKVIVGINDITEQKKKDSSNDVIYDNSETSDIKFELDSNYVFKNVETDNENLLFIPKEQIINHSIHEIFDDKMTQSFVASMNKCSLTKREEILTYPSPNPNEKKMFSAKIKCKGEGVNRKYFISIIELKADE